ncbi:MAG: phage holin [Peptococcaceae bacterium]|nr:phage holin [Peptococcaceae bacterium]MBR2009645.1 phage holin [Peptococcaceae bacterium]
MTKEQIAVLVRTAVLFLALLNQLLLVFGYSILPISEEELSEFLSALLTILSSLWVWWGENRTG